MNVFGNDGFHVSFLVKNGDPDLTLVRKVGSYSISFLVKDGDPDLTLVREWVAIQ